MLAGTLRSSKQAYGMELRRFHANTLPDFMEDMRLASRQQMFFMHDGAPAHFFLPPGTLVHIILGAGLEEVGHLLGHHTLPI